MVREFVSTRIQGEFKENAIEAIMGGEERCPICVEVPAEEEAIITDCGHCYCEPCYKKMIEKKSVCSMCRAQLNDRSFARKVDFAPSMELKSIEESTKVKTIMNLLKKIEEKG